MTNTLLYIQEPVLPCSLHILVHPLSIHIPRSPPQCRQLLSASPPCQEEIPQVLSRPLPPPVMPALHLSSISQCPGEWPKQLTYPSPVTIPSATHCQGHTVNLAVSYLELLISENCNSGPPFSDRSLLSSQLSSPSFSSLWLHHSLHMFGLPHRQPCSSQNHLVPHIGSKSVYLSVNVHLSTSLSQSPAQLLRKSHSLTEQWAQTCVL